MLPSLLDPKPRPSNLPFISRSPIFPSQYPSASVEIVGKTFRLRGSRSFLKEGQGVRRPEVRAGDVQRLQYTSGQFQNHLSPTRYGPPLTRTGLNSRIQLKDALKSASKEEVAFFWVRCSPPLLRQVVLLFRSSVSDCCGPFILHRLTSLRSTPIISYRPTCFPRLEPPKHQHTSPRNLHGQAPVPKVPPRPSQGFVRSSYLDREVQRYVSQRERASLQRGEPRPNSGLEDSLQHSRGIIPFLEGKLNPKGMRDSMANACVC